MEQEHNHNPWRLILALLLIAIGAWILFFRGGGVNTTLVGPDVQLAHVTLNGELSPNASVTVPFTADSDRYTFMNVAADLNHDGQFAAYPTEGAMQEEWIVQNSSARAMEGVSNSFAFQVHDTPAYDREDIPVVVVYADDRLADWDGTVPEQRAAVRAVTVDGFATEEIGDRYQPAEDGEGSTGFPQGFLTPSPAHAQEEGLPNRPPEDYVAATPPATGAEAGTGEGEEELPEDFNQFHADVPDILQGRNECVPTATTNSLLWMADEYDLQDRMPDQATILSELKSDMSWSAANGVVVPAHFLPGKRTFTQRHDLPIETHQVGDRFDLDIVPKIAEELAKGQDVEIDMEYGRYDNNGNYRRTGGHMVTVVGASTAGDSQFLDLHDPLSNRTLDIYRIDGTRVENYRYQGNSVTYIRFAFAESPIEEEEEQSVTAPDDAEDAVRIPGGEREDDRPAEPANETYPGLTAIDVLVLADGYYPTFQFTVAGPDACAADHWHAESTVYGLADVGSGAEARTVSMADPAPRFCGFGTVAEVPRERVLITEEQQTELLKNVVIE